MSIPHVRRTFVEQLTREYMIGQLRENVCRVIFKKTNGEERDMTCTLMSDKIPTTKSEKESKPNLDIVAAWDVNKEGWRSYRVENVISFTCA